MRKLPRGCLASGSSVEVLVAHFEWLLAVFTVPGPNRSETWLSKNWTFRILEIYPLESLKLKDQGVESFHWCLMPSAQVLRRYLLGMIAHSLCEMCGGKCLRTPWPGRVDRSRGESDERQQKAIRKEGVRGWTEVPLGSPVVLVVSSLVEYCGTKVKVKRLRGRNHPKSSKTHSGRIHVWIFTDRLKSSQIKQSTLERTFRTPEDVCSVEQMI